MPFDICVCLNTSHQLISSQLGLSVSAAWHCGSFDPIAAPPFSKVVCPHRTPLTHRSQFDSQEDAFIVGLVTSAGNRRQVPSAWRKKNSSKVSVELSRRTNTPRCPPGVFWRNRVTRIRSRCDGENHLSKFCWSEQLFMTPPPTTAHTSGFVTILPGRRDCDRVDAPRNSNDHFLKLFSTVPYCTVLYCTTRIVQLQAPRIATFDQPIRFTGTRYP